METIVRNYLEIKSLNQLSEIKKPSGNYSLNQVLPNDFQLNKFFYKQIGRNYQWFDRLVWTDKNWIEYVSNPDLFTFVLKDNEEIAGFFELIHHKNKSEIELRSILPYVGETDVKLAVTELIRLDRKQIYMDLLDKFEKDKTESFLNVFKEIELELNSISFVKVLYIFLLKDKDDELLELKDLTGEEFISTYEQATSQLYTEDIESMEDIVSIFVANKEEEEDVFSRKKLKNLIHSLNKKMGIIYEQYKTKKTYRNKQLVKMYKNIINDLIKIYLNIEKKKSGSFNKALRNFVITRI